ncbi:MAG: hypothetical protein ILA34_02860 [Bacteroidaceae bacterium]|nr:hypothetical protein [Bacteroidaceae bacterium]
MKLKRHTILSSVLLLWGLLCLSSCNSTLRIDDDDTDGDKVTVRVGVMLPSSPQVLTKTMGEMTDDKRKDLDLWLFVFDTEGYFVEAVQATPAPVSVGGTGSKTNQGDETLFDVTLTQSKQERIIHFMAYEDAAVHSVMETAALGYGTSDKALIPPLKVTGTQDAYWKRLKVDKITNNVLEGLFRRVPLVRNFAEINVETGASLVNFEYLGFCVCNKPNGGHIAAYNENTGDFVTYDKTEGGTEVSKTYDELQAEQFNGFAPSMTYTEGIPPNEGNDSYFSKDAQYIYETPNATGKARGRTYMIIKGRYKGGSASYYKVDIVRKGEHGTEFYNVLRNVNYRMNINSVTSAGYSTPAEAAQHAASNNISTSVTTESVTNISDGQQRLFVNNTYFCITEGGEYLELKFKYMGPHKTGSVATASYTFGSNETQNASSDYWSNKFISIYATGDSAAMFAEDPVTVMGSTADDWCTVRLKLKNPVSEPQTVNLRLYVDQAKAAADDKLSADDKELYTGEIMSRDITLVLRQRYQWYLDCPASVTGGNLAVNLLIPMAINQRLFPLTFYVEPEDKSIYPDTDPSTTVRTAVGYTAAQIADSAKKNPSLTNNVLAVRVDSTIIPGKSGLSFQYEKILTWEDYQMYDSVRRVNGTNYKVIPLYFKTNTDASATWVYGESQYFVEGAKDQFTNKAPVFDDRYDATVTTTNRLGKGHDIPITYKLLSIPADGIKITVTEGSTTTDTIITTGLNVGVNTFTYKTRTFSERQITAVVSTNTSDATQQTIEPNSDNKRRHILFLPAGTFAPELWVWEKRGEDVDFNLYQTAWVAEEPSIYVLKAGDDASNDTLWIDCGWFNLDVGGIRSDYELDADRPVYKPTNQKGFVMTENDRIKMIGYRKESRIIKPADYIRVGDISDAYAVGGNSKTNGTGKIVAKFTDTENEVTP